MGEHLVGGTGPNRLARRHDISRELPRTRVRKYEAGDLAGGRPTTPDRRACEAKIAGLEWTDPQQLDGNGRRDRGG